MEDFDRDLLHDDQSTAAIVVDGELWPHSRAFLHHLGEQLNAKFRVIIELAVKFLLFLDDREAVLINSGSLRGYM